MRDGVLSFLKIFGILSFVTSLSNLFGLLGGLNVLCDGKQCTDSATRINWLDLHNITNSSGWSESFPSIGVPDVAAITFSFAIVIFAFKEYITTLLHGKVDGQIAEPRMIIENDSDDIEEETEEISFDEIKDKYTVSELKEILKTMNLKTTGNKETLVKRAIENGWDAPSLSLLLNSTTELDPEPSEDILESKSEDVGELAATVAPNFSNEHLAQQSVATNMNIGTVLTAYDANYDGRVEHREYIAVHQNEVKRGGVSSFIDRLLDDSPELRGQRLWVMFALSVLLVAAMNAYAMVREPELVMIEDIVEHTNEVVSIRGTVVSWVEDPYSSGDNRIDIIIEDETGVAELRWYRYGDVPMLGTTVTATGDVIEYEGRIWLQALGGGALSWEESDVPEATLIGISTIAENPEEYKGQTFTITGYLSKSVNPDSTFTALYLGDHPEYGSSEHQMRMVIHSASGQWFESGQKVEVTAVVQYEQRELRWSIHTQGPEVRVLRTHDPVPTEIGWSSYESWSYSSNNLVKLVGQISDGNLVAENGPLSVCLVNAGDLSDIDGETKSVTGRLSWSSSKGIWCIDVDSNIDSGIGEIMGAEDMLLQIASNPEDSLKHFENGTQFNITGYISGSSMMKNDDDTKVIIMNAPYPNTLAKFDAYIPLGMHSGWLEDGQQIAATVTVLWNVNPPELQLKVVNLNLIGEPPEPEFYDLTGGPPEFYDVNKMTTITGNIVTVDGEMYLQKEGGEQKIRINAVSNSIGLNEQHEGLTLKWTGRLIEVADFTTLAHVYVLDEADVTDEDENGIADDAEDF